VNAKDDQNNTLLLTATKNGHVASAALLIKSGADPLCQVCIQYSFIRYDWLHLMVLIVVRVMMDGHHYDMHVVAMKELSFSCCFRKMHETIGL